jgi:hypothetical protein
MNVRETRSDDQEGTIQRHWQHWAHNTQHEDNKTLNHNTENQNDEQYYDIMT